MSILFFLFVMTQPPLHNRYTLGCFTLILQSFCVSHGFLLIPGHFSSILFLGDYNENIIY